MRFVSGVWAQIDRVEGPDYRNAEPLVKASSGAHFFFGGGRGGYREMDCDPHPKKKKIRKILYVHRLVEKVHEIGITCVE